MQATDACHACMYSDVCSLGFFRVVHTHSMLATCNSLTTWGTDFWLDSSSDTALKRFMPEEKVVCLCKADFSERSVSMCGQLC